MATRTSQGETLKAAIASIDTLKKTAEISLEVSGDDPGAVVSAAKEVASNFGGFSYDQGGCTFTLDDVVLAAIPWTLHTKSVGAPLLTMRAVATATWSALYAGKATPRKARGERAKQNGATDNIAGTGGTATQDLGQHGGYATLTVRDPKIPSGGAISVGGTSIRGPLPAGADRILVDPLAGTAFAYANSKPTERTALTVDADVLRALVVDQGQASVALSLRGGATSTSTFVQWVGFTE